MNKTKLSSVVRQSALMTPEKDSFWPIPDQYIGIEIEMEEYSAAQVRTHRNAGSPFWTEHEDGSLRNGTEMVLSQAMMGTSLREAISYFFATFTTYVATPRTSIHVHVNMRQDEETVEGVRNMIALYYMYEDAFFTLADDNRKWCSYCNAFEDTPPAILEAFMNPKASTEGLTMSLHASAVVNQNRYYGLNLNALSKFGTIEFRHFPLVHEEGRLIDWIKLIMELKAAANRMADEGNTPWSVFVQPEDLDKLCDYMPLFGSQLLNLVPSSRAFHRMVSVQNLGTPTVRDSVGEIVKNSAFAIYKDAQLAKGKPAIVPLPFHKDPHCMDYRGKIKAYEDYGIIRNEPLEEAMQQEVDRYKGLLAARIKRLTTEKKRAPALTTHIDTLANRLRDNAVRFTPGLPQVHPIAEGDNFTGATANRIWMDDVAMRVLTDHNEFTNVFEAPTTERAPEQRQEW